MPPDRRGLLPERCAAAFSGSERLLRQCNFTRLRGEAYAWQVATLNRILLGSVLTLCLLGVGLFWLQGRAEVEAAAPPPEPGPAQPPATALPTADPGDLRGPDPPEATELSREQRRFARYDRDSDGRISRNEMLSTRSAAFRALDKDGNNLLTFEEWAVTTVSKFDDADGDRDQYLSRAEFHRIPPPPRPGPKCSC